MKELIHFAAAYGRNLAKSGKSSSIRALRWSLLSLLINNQRQQARKSSRNCCKRYADGKMRHLLVIGLVFLSGCVNLSRQHHMMISDQEADYSDSSCGYFSTQWGQFGSENRAAFSTEDMDVSLCSNAFYSKNIATGFIIPLLPTNGHELHAKRWVKVSNLSNESDFIIHSLLQFCREKYPRNSCGLGETNQSDTIFLRQGESVWIALPDVDEYDLRIESNQTSYTFTFIAKSAYSWWMITV